MTEKWTVSLSRIMVNEFKKEVHDDVFNRSISVVSQRTGLDEERLLGLVSAMNENLKTLNLKTNVIDQRFGTGTPVGNVVHNPTIQDRLPVDSVENFIVFEEVLKKDSSEFIYLVSTQHPSDSVSHFFSFVIYLKFLFRSTK